VQEPLRGGTRDLVLGPRADDRGDEDLEGIDDRLFGHRRNRRQAELREFLLEQPHDGVDVFVLHERNGKRLKAYGLWQQKRRNALSTSRIRT